MEPIFITENMSGVEMYQQSFKICNMSATPTINELYRLPFSKNDNPNGWIEITTHCNLKCPGCYRGCDREDHLGEHEPIEKIKNDIKELVRIRNCDMISISGGEPLTHPGLIDVIRYIRELGLKAWLHTNGKLLNGEKLDELKFAGLNGIIIRVDSLADPSKKSSESQLNEVRKEFAELLASVKGIHLSFISVVNRDNLEQIPDAIKWARKNAELVDFMAIIPMREVKFKKDDEVDTRKWIYLDDLCVTFHKELPGIKYASYLGSTNEIDNIRWLQSLWVVLNGKVLGYIKPKMVELFQAHHHLRHGKYAYKYGRGRSTINVFQLILLGIFFKDAREVRNRFLMEILKNPLNSFKKCSIQLMCFIIPPGNKNRLLDTCDGCPDAMLYNGQLYPSCGLEEIKLHMEEATEP